MIFLAMIYLCNPIENDPSLQHSLEILNAYGELLEKANQIENEINSLGFNISFLIQDNNQPNLGIPA
jgi:hypothetical protein